MNLPPVLPMTVSDLDEVMPMERRSYKDPWTRHMYVSDLTGNNLATYLVLPSPPAWRARAADRGPLPQLLAYGGFWLLLDEAHIATITAHPDWHGCGLGLCLLLALLEQATRRGAALSTLEVRVSNQRARRLYERLGFEQTGARHSYYRDGEDAIIMTTPPLRSPAMQSRLVAAGAVASAKLEACFTDAQEMSET